MSTRTCKNCGWVVASTHKGFKCPICGELYDEVVCYMCGRIVSGKDKVKSRHYGLCRECHNRTERRHMIKYELKQSAKQDAALEDWLDKVAQVPSNYRTLTEADWLEACSYFGRCARCGNHDIDTRGFFIGRDKGGRYCDWNVIPLCQKCSRIWSVENNPFRTVYRRDKMSGTGGAQYLRKNLDNIVKYLSVKIAKAIEENKDE